MGGGGGGVRMGRATTGITAPMRSAAIMAAGGASADAIAAQLGVPVSRVQAWLRRDDIVALINGAVAQAAQLAAPYAQQVLIRQLDDPSPWVAQAAAREVLRQAQLACLETDLALKSSLPDGQRTLELLLLQLAEGAQ